MDRTALEAAIKAHIPFLNTAGLCYRNALCCPDKQAVIDTRRRLTWRQVHSLSDQLAIALRDLGLNRDRPLLVQLPNCSELFLARLACEKAGVACVTVSPAFKLMELKAIIKHTRPRAAMIFHVFRRTDYLSLIREADESQSLQIIVAGDSNPQGTLSLEALTRDIDLQTAHENLKETSLSPLDWCQIATTSGSSGLPKCVQVAIYSRLLTSRIQSQRFELSQTDVIAPFGSIVSGTSEALGFFGVTLLGATAVLVDHFDPEEVLRCLRDNQVTFACMVPTMVAKVANALADRQLEQTKLRGIATYGSSMHIPSAERIERLLGARIVQGYGTMDYGGISATCWKSGPEVRIGTVGRPLEGNQVIVCDDEGTPLGRGGEGFIRVRGLHSVGKYHNAPELDAQKWKGEYFDVGEIGKFDKDGNLIVLGRADDVIIRGGQNIYPEDVESVIAGHPFVREVAVIGITDSVYGQKLCAFIVLKSGCALSAVELTEFLKKSGVAYFKIPEIVAFVPDLPRGASGEKISKKDLAEKARQYMA